MIRALIPALALALMASPAAAQDARLVEVLYDEAKVVRIDGRIAVQASRIAKGTCPIKVNSSAASDPIVGSSARRAPAMKSSSRRVRSRAVAGRVQAYTEQGSTDLLRRHSPGSRQAG